jgi:ABC-type multidrug transport system fused ATPase/permease subunit
MKFSSKRAGLPDLRRIYQFLRLRKRVMLGGFTLVLLGRAATLVLPLAGKVLIDDVAFRRRGDLLLPLALLLVGTTAINVVARLALNLVFTTAANRLVTDMRIRLQGHLASLPVRYFDGNKAGSLSASVLADTEGLRDLFGTGIFEFVGGILSAAAAAILMFRINVPMTLLALLFILIYTLATWPLLRKMRPMFRERTRLSSLAGGRLTEVFSGIRIVKGFHAERRTSRAFTREALGIFRHMTSIVRG